jgi:hypothetical protein
MPRDRHRFTSIVSAQVSPVQQPDFAAGGRPTGMTAAADSPLANNAPKPTNPRAKRIFFYGDPTFGAHQIESEKRRFAQPNPAVMRVGRAPTV